MAKMICTYCFYEGKAVQPPSDSTIGLPDSDTNRSIDKMAGMFLGPWGMLVRPLALLIAMPLYLILWIFRGSISTKKHCPHCGLPLMVSLKSDAGFIAKRKLEVKAGKQFTKPPPPTIAFGREVTLPEETKAGANDPFDDFETPIQKLPTLQQLIEIEEAEARAAAASAPQEPTPPPPAPKKPADPDSW